MKRLLFLILFLPVFVFGDENSSFRVGNNFYENTKEGIASALNDASSSGNDLVILKDITIDNKFEISSDMKVVIDLNGKNVVSNIATFNNAGNLTIKGNDASIFTYDGKWMSNLEGGVLVLDGGNYNYLEVEGVTDSSTHLISNDGVLTFKNGKFNFGDLTYGIIGSGELNFDDGIFTSANYCFVSDSSGVYYSGKIIINGGEFLLDNVGLDGFNTAGDVFVNGGVFSYGDEELGSLFSLHRTAILTWDGADVSLDRTIISLGNNNEINILSGRLESTDTVISGVCTGSCTINIGVDDGIIKNSPTLIASNYVYGAEGTIINFYDGTITGTAKVPLNMDKLNTLPSYNIKDNNNGTYTARLVSDDNYDVSTDEELVPDNNDDGDSDNSIFDNNFFEEITNPKTGVSFIYFIVVCLVISSVIIIRYRKKANAKDL